MVRVLERFGLSHPCNTPMLVVAYTSMHAAVVLAGINMVIWRGNKTFPYHGYDARITDRQLSLCQKLYALASKDLQGHDGRWCIHVEEHMPAETRSIARGLVRAAAPQLPQTFDSFNHFLQLAQCQKTYAALFF